MRRAGESEPRLPILDAARPDRYPRAMTAADIIAGIRTLPSPALDEVTRFVITFRAGREIPSAEARREAVERFLTRWGAVSLEDVPEATWQRQRLERLVERQVH
jgi:hypothetical protein